jgi:hypothetical protein
LNDNGEKKKISDMVEARMIDNITVVGKSEPVRVYELCAIKGGLTDQEKQLFKIFDHGMQHYLKMEWDEAIAKFNESRNLERVPPRGTSHKQPRSLTPRLLKRAIYGWKLNKTRKEYHETSG